MVKHTEYVSLHQDTGKYFLLCVAVLGGCCKHVAALRFYCMDFIQLEVSEVPGVFICTQLRQQWHVPASEYLKTALLFD